MRVQQMRVAPNRRPASSPPIRLTQCPDPAEALQRWYGLGMVNSPNIALRDHAQRTVVHPERASHAWGTPPHTPLAGAARHGAMSARDHRQLSPRRPHAIPKTARATTLIYSTPPVRVGPAGNSINISLGRRRGLRTAYHRVAPRISPRLLEAWPGHEKEASNQDGSRSPPEDELVRSPAFCISQSCITRLRTPACDHLLRIR